MLVDSFQEIKFDTDAYEHLELDHDHKSLIRALVDASREDRKEQLISDVVAGKGGGIIVTMHGPPGTGKTLTAEAVAELQQRPLYVVAAGELGIDAFHLERRLRETLEIARVWRAVVLIDEADSESSYWSYCLYGRLKPPYTSLPGSTFLVRNFQKLDGWGVLARTGVSAGYPVSHHQSG